MTIVSSSKPCPFKFIWQSDNALQHRMLKEKKKLMTKVESLTRKVQNLQTRLAAAKEPPSIPSVETLALPPSMPPIPPVPPIPVHEAKTPVSRSVSNRVVSGPASLSRPKTPERRLAQPTVFKARTPEKRAPPTPTAPVVTIPPSSSSSSSVGKKRARPDEFDAVSVPVQALYADEQQEREHTTPRLRRALHSIHTHTGFTPVRHGSGRTAQGVASPGRRVTTGATGISDMTNSPRSMADQSAKAGKRSWLGKIRGVSSQTSSRTPSSRPGVFEKVPRP